MTSDSNELGSPRVLERALAILSLFTDQRREWTAAEIAREIGVPLSTTYRLCSALEAHALLRRVPGQGLRLGRGAIVLGQRATAAYDIGEALRPGLERIALETNETTTLSIFEPDLLGSLCVARFEGVQNLRLSLEVGRVIPLHAGAAAKALLAFLGEEVLEKVLARPLPALGPTTITDPAALRAEVETIRARGWSFSRGETDEGAWGVGVPVLDQEGTALAVIGVAAPTPRYSDELRDRAIALASSVAATIDGAPGPPRLATGGGKPTNSVSNGKGGRSPR